MVPARSHAKPTNPRVEAGMRREVAGDKTIATAQFACGNTDLRGECILSRGDRREPPGKAVTSTVPGLTA